MNHKNFNPNNVLLPTNYFVKNFKRFREIRGISFPKLAEVMGVHRNTVFRVASGKTQPTLDILMFLSELAGCTIDDFCFNPYVFDEDKEDNNE